jgi:hypothetical protein
LMLKVTNQMRLRGNGGMRGKSRKESASIHVK